MTDDEIKSEIDEFISDIRRWEKANDFKSAAQMARALSRFLLDVKGYKL